MTTADRTLEYAPKRKRSSWRWLFVVMGVLPLVGVIRAKWQPISLHVRLYLLAPKCMEAQIPHSAPLQNFAGRTVIGYDFEGDVQLTTATPQGALWFTLEKQIIPKNLIEYHGPITFLHRLKTPAGLDRLVVLEKVEGGKFSPIVVDPGTLYRFPRMTSVTVREDDATHTLLDIGPELRGWKYYAGQPDPNDPSRFTFRYEMHGQATLVEGKIDDQDVVTLKVMDAQAFARRIGVKIPQP